MILGKKDIIAALDSGDWKCHRDGVRIGSEALTVNSNSVNCTLGDIVLYQVSDGAIDLEDSDSLQWNAVRFTLWQVDRGDFYLMHVRERFDCAAPLFIHGRERYFAPMIEGRSTLARCGLAVHQAGFGDWGFDANFTLEITAALPIILRPGYEIAQVSFVEVSSPSRYDSVYSDQYDAPREPKIGKGRFGL